MESSDQSGDKLGQNHISCLVVVQDEVSSQPLNPKIS